MSRVSEHRIQFLFQRVLRRTCVPIAGFSLSDSNVAARFCTFSAATVRALASVVIALDDDVDVTSSSVATLTYT